METNDCTHTCRIIERDDERFNDVVPNLYDLMTAPDGDLVHDIAEDDFNVSKEGQVEIIGWMYQYYISEKHDQIINIYKGTIKKEDIPAATQLFTTDWVVRYIRACLMPARSL